MQTSYYHTHAHIAENPALLQQTSISKLAMIKVSEQACQLFKM